MSLSDGERFRASQARAIEGCGYARQSCRAPSNSKPLLLPLLDESTSLHGCTSNNGGNSKVLATSKPALEWRGVETFPGEG